ncbi:MAG: hypothetical protein ACP5I3_11795 [Thermoproteus sp.]
MVSDKIKAAVAIGMLILMAYVGSAPQVVVWYVTQNGTATAAASSGTATIGVAVIKAVAAELTAKALIALGLGWVGLVVVVA